MKLKIKDFVMIAMLTALAYVTMLMILIPFPAASFLTYDPKDVFIIIGGFLYGPLVVIPMSVIVSLLEMPITNTGPYGLIMNIASTCSFAFTTALIYKKWRTIVGAAVGLGIGVIIMVGVMMLLNYTIAPIYTNAPREVVAKMLLPVFMPFNLFKGIYNAAITMLVYKKLSSILTKIHLTSKK